jgi:hypothetical protein
MNRYGVDFHVSTNVPTSAGNPIGLILQKEALCAAVQMNMTMKDQYVIQHAGHAYLGQLLYGVAEYRDTFGVKWLA